MESLFYPQSMAVIGVSENPENLPRVIAGNLLRFGYPGRLHLVGRRAGQLDGHPILASIEAIPGQVDAAVVLTPAE
ncbi:MAG TPA: CoA-binding protein, partial [Anaerolineaceae bacterium]